MTAAEFLAIPEEALCELINGEFIVNTANDTRHQRVLLRVMGALMRYCDEHHRAEAFLGSLDVVLSDDTVVAPDGLLIRRDRASIIGEKYIDGPPDLVVEVAAERTRHRDEVVKPRRVRAMGCQRVLVGRRGARYGDDSSSDWRVIDTRRNRGRADFAAPAGVRARHQGCFSCRVAATR